MNAAQRPHPTSCAACGKPAITRCKGCKSVAYCNASCQKQHWQEHKNECKRVSRAAREEKARRDAVLKAKFDAAASVAVEECRSISDISEDARCYICYKGGDLVRGCACRGPSAGICHLACLLKFAEAQIDEEDYMKALHKCRQCQQYFLGVVDIALCRAMWRHFVSLPETNEWRARACWKLGLALAQTNELDEAEALLSECATSAHRNFGPSSEFAVKSREQLAVVRYRKPNCDRAALERSLQTLEGIHAWKISVNLIDEAVETAATLAELHSTMGNLVKAAAYYRKAKAGYTRKYGEASADAIQSRYFLIDTLLALGSHDESLAEGAAEEAFAEYEGLFPLALRVFGPEHVIVNRLRRLVEFFESVRSARQC